MKIKVEKVFIQYSIYSFMFSSKIIICYLKWELLNRCFYLDFKWELVGVFQGESGEVMRQTKFVLKLFETLVLTCSQLYARAHFIINSPCIKV